MTATDTQSDEARDDGYEKLDELLLIQRSSIQLRGPMEYDHAEPIRPDLITPGRFFISGLPAVLLLQTG